MKKNEFLISLLIYIPLGIILSFINYKSGENIVLSKAITFGFIGALSVFFVPFIYKIFKKKTK